jgi:hypothetical protein
MIKSLSSAGRAATISAGTSKLRRISHGSATCLSQASSGCAARNVIPEARSPSTLPPFLRRQANNRMGWTLTFLGGGYARIDGVLYTAYVVVTDEVTEAERDEYLRLFSHRPAKPGEATQWLRQWMKETKMKQPNMEELPGFEELFAKSIKKALEKMPLEERLEGLAPEQLIPALPLEALRALPEEYLGSLPAEIQEQVRRRLQKAAH